MPRILQRLAHGDAGFTLIETLVAIVTGLVVMGALFMILEVSLRQSARITDRVQADQLGRTAMTKIVDELHSACLAREFAPIRAESSGTVLRFRNAYSEEPVINAVEPKPEAFEQKIEWKGETLRDSTYPSNGGEWPNFTFSPTPKTTVIATNVTPTGSTPIFRYYKYATESSSGLETGVSTLTPLSPEAPLTEVTAKEAAAVVVSFTTAPTNKYAAQSRSVPFSSQVTFAFSPPVAGSTSKYLPCQ